MTSAPKGPYSFEAGYTQTMSQENNETMDEEDDGLPEPSPQKRSPFRSPLEDWENLDVLGPKEDRDRLTRLYGERAARLLTAKKLRRVFRRHEAHAKPARRRWQGRGVRGVALGTLGLCAVAIVALVDPASTVARLLAGGASLLAAFGIGTGVVQSMRDPSKNTWLFHRFVTERVRQFQFQYVLRHLSDALEGLSSDEAMADFERKRDAAIDRFESVYLDPDNHRFEQTLDDEAYLDSWILGEPDRSVPPDAARSENLETIFRMFEDLRIGVQYIYAHKKLIAGPHSPSTRAAAVRQLGNWLTFGVMVATVVAGAALFAFGTGSSLAIFATVAGTCCASLVAAVRVMDDGFALQAESDRYQWYKRSLEIIRDRFRDSDNASERLRLLHELEALAYREMRMFLIDQGRTRFVTV